MKNDVTRVPMPSLSRGLIAILRGIKPEETKPIILSLLEAGFEAIEIPLNSPTPFKSIEIARKTVDEAGAGNCLLGAGTVLEIEQVNSLQQAGGNLMVSPNINREVIIRASELGMVTMPGVFSPTEALKAVSAGATGLKFFPANILGPAGISAICAVLPDDIIMAAVGGVSEVDFPEYAVRNIKHYGLGSSLYKPGATAKDVAVKAGAVIAAYDKVYKS